MNTNQKEATYGRYSVVNERDGAQSVYQDGKKMSVHDIAFTLMCLEIDANRLQFKHGKVKAALIAMGQVTEQAIQDLRPVLDKSIAMNTKTPIDRGEQN